LISQAYHFDKPYIIDIIIDKIKKKKEKTKSPTISGKTRKKAAKKKAGWLRVGGLGCLFFAMLKTKESGKGESATG
jgi:hypothetical protein